MIIDGEDAAKYQAVRLDSFEQVNTGKLISANDETGYVSWLAADKSEVKVTLGQNAIRILRKSSYGRS